MMGLNRVFQRTKAEKTSIENISLIIPFKNEKNNIPDLLAALNKLDYPSDKYEIIFVNDNSSDESMLMLDKNLSTNYKVVSVTDKKYPGKKGALDFGIQQAKFEIIAITDADCEPEPYWLKSISYKISEGSDVVFGYSPLKAGIKLVSKISAFENLRNYILYFFSAGLGIPYSATSRSFAFRKEVYFKLNGYSNTLETLSGDDDLFIREAVKQRLKIVAFRNGNDLVYSKASDSFRDYFNRKSRHLKTSQHYLIRHQIMLAVWHTINIASVYSLLLFFVSNWFLLPFTIKMIFDLLLTQKVKSKLLHDFSLYEVIFLQPVYETFLIINFINSLFTKDKWK